MLNVKLNETDLSLLVEIQNYFNDIGLGKIFGACGRSWAIIHHDLLNDDPCCQSWDQDGNLCGSNLSNSNRRSIEELASHLDDIKEIGVKKHFYERLGLLIDRIQNQACGMSR